MPETNWHYALHLPPETEEQRANRRAQLTLAREALLERPEFSTWLWPRHRQREDGASTEGHAPVAGETIQQNADTQPGEGSSGEPVGLLSEDEQVHLLIAIYRRIARANRSANHHCSRDSTMSQVFMLSGMQRHGPLYGNKTFSDS